MAAWIEDEEGQRNNKVQHQHTGPSMKESKRNDN